MSQNRLSLITPSIAQQIASDFLEARRAKHLHFTMTAGTGEGGEGAGAGTGGAGGEGAGGAGGEGTPSGGTGGTDAGGDPQKKISALEEEKDRHYQARQKAEEELKKYQDAENERTRASNDELTNTKNDLAAAQQTLAETKAALDAALLDNAFLTENTHAWQNPARVLKLVDRDAVKIEDGKVIGVKEALEALAKTDPYLLKTEDPGEGAGNGTPGTGPKHNGTKGKGEAPTRDELARKYPALRR